MVRNESSQVKISLTYALRFISPTSPTLFNVYLLLLLLLLLSSLNEEIFFISHMSSFFVVAKKTAQRLLFLFLLLLQCRPRVEINGMLTMAEESD